MRVSPNVQARLILVIRQADVLTRVMKVVETIHLTEICMMNVAAVQIITNTNEYYNGFVAGCLSVKGNTAEICEETTDS